MILETTRIRGVLKGDVAGRLEIVGVPADQRIKPGEKVLTAGGDLIFPRGLPVGVVEKVVPDPDNDGLIIIYVKPAAHLDQLDEVLVITSTEPRFSPQEQQDITTSVDEKGAEAAAMSDQLKASQIMAEKLPGLVEPNLPPDQQPLYDTSNPNPVTQPPQPLHPDEFSPGAAVHSPNGCEWRHGFGFRPGDIFLGDRYFKRWQQSGAPKCLRRHKRRRRGIHSHGPARRRSPA